MYSRFRMLVHDLEEFQGVKLFYLNEHKSSIGSFKNIYEENLFFFNSKQDSISTIKKAGTIKGLHFQVKPYEQAKLITVLNGSLIDFFVDLRPSSKTFLDHGSIKLSKSNNALLFLPKGFAHGYISLEDDTHIFYKLDNVYMPSHEKTLHWKDEIVNIDWPIQGDYQISDKDESGLNIKGLKEFL